MEGGGAVWPFGTQKDKGNSLVQSTLTARARAGPNQATGDISNDSFRSLGMELEQAIGNMAGSQARRASLRRCCRDFGFRRRLAVPSPLSREMGKKFICARPKSDDLRIGSRCRLRVPKWHTRARDAATHGEGTSGDGMNHATLTTTPRHSNAVISGQLIGEP